MRTPMQFLLTVVLAGMAFNAHALCVKPDGSLDDASLSRDFVAMDMLPACKNSESKKVDTPKADPSTAKQYKQGPAQPDIAPVNESST